MHDTTQGNVRLFILVMIGCLVFSSQTRAETVLKVAVIAHSVSTSIEARKVRMQQGWTETTNLRQADAILVVCRSGLIRPLDSSYNSIQELDRDAESQLNIVGLNFHVYIYRINDDLSVDEIKHVHYPTDDWLN